MCDIVSKISAIISDELLKSDYKKIEIDLRKIFSDLNIDDNKGLRYDILSQVYINLDERLITLEFKDDKVCVFSKLDEIYREFIKYECPLTLKQIDRIVLKTIKANCRASHSFINSMFSDNFDLTYSNKYYIYTVAKGYKLKIKWDILTEKEDKENTVVFPDGDLQTPCGTWISKKDLQNHSFMCDM